MKKIRTREWALFQTNAVHINKACRRRTLTMAAAGRKEDYVSYEDRLEKADGEER